MGTLIGLAIIAKNEEKNLPHLLESIDGAFDRVVLLDTGSTDGTIDVFAAWAKNQPALTFSTAQWDWIDDFSDARNAADRLLLYGVTDPDVVKDIRPMVDWRSWADCDDIIIGAKNLRNIAEQADPRVTAFFANYDYAQDPSTGQCVIRLPRERMIRSEYPIGWQGRVHEATPITQGAITSIPDDLAQWKHRKQESEGEAAIASNGRNLAILHKWNDDEPGNPRVVGYLGTEHAVRGELDEAIKYFLEYLSCNSQWDQERAQIRRKLCVAYAIQGELGLAEEHATHAMLDVPTWPDSYLTLAEMALLRGENKKCEFWAKRVLELGHPETVLITNPSDYELTPRKLLALAYGRSGNIDDAVELGTQVAMAQPNDQNFIAELHEWRTSAKRERTADTYVMASEQLVGHDEQEKARILLEQCVPHFAFDHPKVVGERSRVRERLLWANNPAAYEDHYETGGSKPEDFIPDDQIDKLCEYLPRTNFLLSGIRDQIEETK